MQDFFYSSKEKRLYNTLSKYHEQRGLFEAIYTGITLSNIHPYINSNGATMLFEDLYSVNDNEYICKYFFLNKCATLVKPNLQAGTKIRLNLGSEIYHFGRNYHPNNIWRPGRQMYRLLYPSQLIILEHTNNYVPPTYKPIIGIRSGKEYNNYYEYIKSANIINNELIERILIQLIHSSDYRLLFNKNNKFNSELYVPKLIFKETYDKLPKECLECLDYIRNLDYIQKYDKTSL